MQNEVVWRNDAQMARLAFELGQKMTQMLANAGQELPDYPVPHPEGAPSPDPHQEVIDSIIRDAMDFTSPDPQKITDEFLRMQKAAYATGPHSQAVTDLRYAHAKIAANWHGDAAKAFANQVTNIELFMSQQELVLTRAAQGMGAAFALAVRIRESYCNMVNALDETCRNIINEQFGDGDSSVSISMGIEVVKSVTDLLTFEKAGELKDWVIEKFFNLASDAADSEPIDDSGAVQVVDSYIRARDQLRKSLDDGLKQLGKWFTDQDHAYGMQGIPLWEPLPAYCDVDSPDFSYEHFYNNGHDKGRYTPKVEQERKKYVEEKQHPTGIIAERLGGGE